LTIILDFYGFCAILLAMRNDIVQSTEQMSGVTGISPEMNSNDSRLRTGRYEATQADDGEYVQLADEDVIPIEDEPPVQTGDVKREPPLPPRPKHAGESVAADPEMDQVLAAKKKGGGEGGGRKKGKGKKGGEGGKKNDEQVWNDPDKVKPAIEAWSTEVLELDAQIAEQKKTEQEEKPSITLERLKERKEILEKRLKKGRAKVALERKKEEVRSIEDELVEVQREIEKQGKDSPPELLAKRDRLTLLAARGKEDVQEMMAEYIRDFPGVAFDDANAYEALPSIHVHVSKEEEKEKITVGKTAIGAAVIGGATVGSMLELTGGLLKDLWKSWRGHVKNPNKTFGGKGWRDFFWPPDKKK
jgi:hypothetical protein